MRIFLALSLAVCLLAPAPISAVRRADSNAQKLVRLQLPKDQFAQTIKMMQQQIGAMFQAQSNIPPEKLAKLQKAVGEVYSYEELVTETAKVMAKAFTEAEMKQLVDFYTTPLGKKSVAVLPQVIAASAAWSSQKIQTALPGIMQSL